MVTDLDKKIVLDEIVGYDGSWEGPYKSFATTYAEEKDPIINDYMIEKITREMSGNGGCSRLPMYSMIEKLVGVLNGSEGGFQAIDNVPWTSDDIYDVMEMVGRKLLPKIKKRFRGREVFGRIREDGILEFRLKQ